MAYGITVKYVCDRPSQGGTPNYRCIMEAIGGDYLSVLDLLQVAYDLLRVSTLKSDEAPTPEPKQMLEELTERLCETGVTLHEKYKLSSTIEYKIPDMNAENDSVN